jgi:hypothetical protein
LPAVGDVVDLVAGRLIDVGRVAAAATYVSGAARATPQNRKVLLLQILNAYLLGHKADPEAAHLAEHDFVLLFAALRANADDDEDRGAIAELEWAFLPLLGLEPHVPALSKELTRNPVLFVDVVSTMYTPQGDADGASDPDPLTPEELSRALRATTLMGSITHLPGQSDDGTVHYEVLAEWGAPPSKSATEGAAETPSLTM